MDIQASHHATRLTLLRQQRVLARFGQFALMSESLDNVLTEACALVGEALGTDLAKVMELQADGETLLVRAGVGWLPGVVGVAVVPADIASSEGFALQAGVPVVSPDISLETRFRYAGFLRDNGVQAIVNVPIPSIEGRPAYGLLQVDSRAPRDFDGDDISFLRGYANLVAAAVDRLRCLEALRNTNQELERRVLERTLALTDANERLHAEATAREQAQEALRLANRTVMVVENLPFGAGLLTPDGEIIVANREFSRLLPQRWGHSGGTVEGGSWSAFHPDGSPLLPDDYPGAQALRGTLVLNQDFLHEGMEGAYWRRVSGIPVHSRTGEVVAALVVIMDIDTEKRATERQVMLTREVDHRAKNMLSVVQSALRLTRATDTASFIRVVEGRVMALARAQSLLAANHWSGVDLRSLLRGELASFLASTEAGPRVELQGPPVTLPHDAAQPFSMAVHELVTNAIRHGALSSPTGQVTVTWRQESAAGNRLHLYWVETGGPPLAGPPSTRGFGIRVLTGTLRDQMGGICTMHWPSAGLAFEIDVPLVA